MSNAETIKEFLVALGFKVDERSFRKFDEATGLSTRNLAKLGFTATAAAAAVTAFVVKVGQSLDRLYFASKRTGSAAEEINAFGFAVGQMGGNADEAKASLENLARFMRTNPGSGGLLTRALGVKPENLKDTVKVMNDLARTFQRMPFYLASRYAGMLGIDEKTLIAMRETGKLSSKEDDYKRMVAERGIDLNALSEKSMEFNNQLKTLDSSFGLLAADMEGHLLPAVMKLNEWVLKFTSFTAGNSPAAHAVGDWLLTARDYLRTGIWNPPDSSTGGSPEAGAPRGIRNNNPGNLRKWGNMPTSGGFAVFPNAEAGLGAMAKQLLLYQQRGWNTVSKIVDHWAPASDGNNTKSYKDRLAQHMGVGWNEKLNLNNATQMAELMHGITTHENGKNPYSAPLMVGAARSAIRNATLNQKTEIKIMGGDKNTAGEIAAQQNSVNQQAVRNLAGAVQ